MLRVTTLASSSSGNCLLVSGNGSHLLIDAGISCRRITTALDKFGLELSQLDGILITHEHSDHICGLATLIKKHTTPIFASPGTARALEYRLAFHEGQLRPVEIGAEFAVGGLTAQAFATSHDSAQSTGYCVRTDKHRMVLATDLGFVSNDVLNAVLGCDILVAESNHDVDWLRSGPYPPYLQERILGNRGHLCNEAGAELVTRAALSGTHTIILAHLSQENNTPARALDVARRSLCAAGIDPDRDVTLTVAPVCDIGPTFFAERSECPC